MSFSISIDRDDMVMVTPDHVHPINFSLSPSPDSNTSDRDADSSPDVNMLDSDGSARQTPDSATSPQPNGNSLNNTSTNLNAAFVSPGTLFFWDNLSTSDTGAQNDQTFSVIASDGTRSAAMSPSSTGKESQVDSCEASRRGSTENDSFSISSGEMLVRANSFSLDDQSLIVPSPLEESVFSPESNLRATILLDSGESPEEKNGAITPSLGMTFVRTEPFSDELQILELQDSEVAPSGKGLMKTFIYETSTDCAQESWLSGAGQHHLTPDQDKPSEASLLFVPETNEVWTSTPLHQGGHRMPSVPSLGESPCTGNAESSGLGTIQEQENSASQVLAARMPPPVGKVKKAVMRFPKADFSSIKSKVVTRNLHHMSVQGSASQRRSQNDKRTEAHGAAARMTPAKGKSSVTSKMATDDQRRVNTGSDAVTAQSAGQSKTPAALEASAASFDTDTVSGQAADAAEQHAGNQTFSFSFSEKSHAGSGQTDPKPTPKKGVLNKIQVRPGSALAQDKRPAFSLSLRTWTRSTSESSTSSSRTPQKSRATLGSTRVATPKVDTRQAQSKAGRLNSSSCATPKDSRAAKRTSLVVSTTVFYKYSFNHQASDGFKYQYFLNTGAQGETHSIDLGPL